jgi:hypothetical protein
MTEEKINEFDTTHIISSISLNGYLTDLGEDTEQAEPYYVETSVGGDMGECVFSMRSANLLDALRSYSDQILNHARRIQLDREDKAENKGVEDITLTEKHCLPDAGDADYTGQLIIVDAKSLLPEYRSSDSQLVRCTHGNGARPNAIGTSVFGTELFTDNTVVYGRHQIAGIADPSQLPAWAKKKLAERESPRKERTAGKTEQPSQSKKPQSLLSELRETTAIVERRKAERGGASDAKNKQRGGQEV